MKAAEEEEEIWVHLKTTWELKSRGKVTTVSISLYFVVNKNVLWISYSGAACETLRLRPTIEFLISTLFSVITSPFESLFCRIIFPVVTQISQSCVKQLFQFEDDKKIMNWIHNSLLIWSQLSLSLV